MTSEEIKSKSAFDVSNSRWLQEIAYQLALANEHRFERKANIDVPRSTTPIAAPIKQKQGK